LTARGDRFVGERDEGKQKIMKIESKELQE